MEDARNVESTDEIDRVKLAINRVFGDVTWAWVTMVERPGHGMFCNCTVCFGLANTRRALLTLADEIFGWEGE